MSAVARGTSSRLTPRSVSVALEDEHGAPKRRARIVARRADHELVAFDRNVGSKPLAHLRRVRQQFLTTDPGATDPIEDGDGTLAQTQCVVLEITNQEHVVLDRHAGPEEEAGELVQECRHEVQLSSLAFPHRHHAEAGPAHDRRAVKGHRSTDPVPGHDIALDPRAGDAFEQEDRMGVREERSVGDDGEVARNADLTSELHRHGGREELLCLRPYAVRKLEGVHRVVELGADEKGRALERDGASEVGRCRDVASD